MIWKLLVVGNLCDQVPALTVESEAGPVVTAGHQYLHGEWQIAHILQATFQGIAGNAKDRPRVKIRIGVSTASSGRGRPPVRSSRTS